MEEHKVNRVEESQAMRNVSEFESNDVVQEEESKHNV